MNYEQLQQMIKQWADGHGGYRETLPGEHEESVPGTDIKKKTPVQIVYAKDGSWIKIKSNPTPDGGWTYQQVGDPHITTPTATERATPSTSTTTTTGNTTTKTVVPTDDAGNPTGPPRTTDVVIGEPKPAEPLKEKDEGGRHWVWKPNPDGKGGFWEDVGPAAAPESGDRQQVPNRPGWVQITRKKTNASGGTDSETVYQGPDGTIHPTLPGQTTRAENLEPVKGHPGMFTRQVGTKDANGNTVQKTEYVDAQGNPIAGPGEDANWQPLSGSPGTLYNTKTGETKKVDQFQATDWGNLKFEAGQISTDLTNAYNAANARRIRGEISNEQMTQELKPLFDVGNARINEINGIMQSQSTIYSNESANYRQASTVAGNTFANATKNMADRRGYLNPGSEAGGKAFLAELALGAQYQQMFAPQPTLPTGLQQARGLGLPGMPGASAGTTPPQVGQQGGVTINIGAGLGAEPGQVAAPPQLGNPLANNMAQMGLQQQAREQTISQIKDDPFFAPVLNDFIGPSEMTTTDQQRAPGFSAGMPAY